MVISPKPATPTASFRNGLYVVAVLLLPLLVLWHGDNVLYSPPWCTDPWFYLGYFKDLADFKRDLFPSFHSGSRYPWILPGYLIHSLFPPRHRQLHPASDGSLDCRAVAVFGSPGHRRRAWRLPDGDGVFFPSLAVGRNRVGLCGRTGHCVLPAGAGVADAVRAAAGPKGEPAVGGYGACRNGVFESLLDYDCAAAASLLHRAGPGVAPDGREVGSQSGAFGHEPYRRWRLPVIRNEEQRDRVLDRARGQRRAIRNESNQQISHHKQHLLIGGMCPAL